MERQFREGSNGSAPKCRNPQPEVGRKQKPDFGHVLHKCSAPDANTAGNSVAHLSPFTNLLYTNLPFVRPNPLPVSAPRCPPPCRCGRLPGEDAGGHRPKARAVGAGRGASLPWQGSDPYSVCRWCVLKKNGDTSLVPLDQPPPPRRVAADRRGGVHAGAHPARPPGGGGPRGPRGARRGGGPGPGPRHPSQGRKAEWLGAGHRDLCFLGRAARGAGPDHLYFGAVAGMDHQMRPRDAPIDLPPAPQVLFARVLGLPSARCREVPKGIPDRGRGWTSPPTHCV